MLKEGWKAGQEPEAEVKKDKLIISKEYKTRVELVKMANISKEDFSKFLEESKKIGKESTEEQLKFYGFGFYDQDIKKRALKLVEYEKKLERRAISPEGQRNIKELSEESLRIKTMLNYYVTLAYMRKQDRMTKLIIVLTILQAVVAIYSIFLN